MAGRGVVVDRLLYGVAQRRGGPGAEGGIDFLCLVKSALLLHLMALLLIVFRGSFVFVGPEWR